MEYRNINIQLGLNKKDRTMIALDYGTDIHEAVPYMYERETVQEGLEIFKNKKRRNAFQSLQ